MLQSLMSSDIKIRRLGHPLAMTDGRIQEARYLMYEKNLDKRIFCRWCERELFWRKGLNQNTFGDSACVDHLDRDHHNNDISNLAISCRACNANRHTHGRVKNRNCERCNEEYKPKKTKQRFCGNRCSSLSKPKREITMKHGTRSRYTHGCRCTDCRKSNTEYAKKMRAASAHCHQQV